MQNSELFRRGIVLPVHADAEEQLRMNGGDTSTPVHYLEIPDESQFNILWELQLFEEINVRTGSLIDDFEEEFIEADSIDCLLEVIHDVRAKEAAQHPEIQVFLNRLSELATMASKIQRALLFVL